MGKIEMKLSDLCELYILVDLYEKTYGQPEITVGELKETVRKKCEERGMTNGIRNSRDAGRKKKYSEETDRKIMDGHRKGKTIRKIAAETGCSTGYVQKLISEHRKKGAVPRKQSRRRKQPPHKGHALDRVPRQ